MQVICHGIDLVDCCRIQQLLDRHGNHFVERVFTPAELNYSRKNRRPSESLAGRFAVKEAVMKMLGTGWRQGIAWTDIETRNDPAGKPIVYLYGVVAELAGQMGIEQISVAITHTKDLAIASTIALGTSTDKGTGP